MSSSDKKRARIIKTLSKCGDIPDPERHFKALLEIKQRFDEEKDKQMLLKVFDAIGNRERLLILDTLKEKDRCVCELEAIMEKVQASVSHHLRILEQAGLIQGWKKGKFTHYSLVKCTFTKFTQMLDGWVASTRNWFGDVQQQAL
nr:metalloregulator ArsR/SmtB family transcription factor [Candidatus Sigynarchaeota archaeon]